ncbi:MAG TPA: hypothetical protein VFV47_12285 [Hyphomicrobiaceae bacterium]|nr:hypothetical protein [Hyphomicrobiaceae bacterium]
MIDETAHGRILQRAAELQDWLEKEAPYVQFDQRHLDAHTPEQAYWHFGYQSALNDLLVLIRTRTGGSADTASLHRTAGPDESH